MAQNKTQPTETDVDGFLEGVEPERRREDAKRLKEIFDETTGFTAKMWGSSIVGYGKYHYKYESGREGDMIATGFSPRKANLVVYVVPGYSDFGELLGRLGKHKLGKSCLYLNKLADIDEDVLKELIVAGLKDLGTRWDIHPE